MRMKYPPAMARWGDEDGSDLTTVKQLVLMDTITWHSWCSSLKGHAQHLRIRMHTWRDQTIWSAVAALLSRRQGHYPTATGCWDKGSLQKAPCCGWYKKPRWWNTSCQAASGSSWMQPVSMSTATTLLNNADIQTMSFNCQKKQLKQNKPKQTRPKLRVLILWLNWKNLCWV